MKFISGATHGVMGVAMVAMALFGVRAGSLPAAFFMAAAFWFALLATAAWLALGRRAGRPAAALGHAVMTAGMAATLLLPQLP